MGVNRNKYPISNLYVWVKQIWNFQIFCILSFFQTSASNNHSCAGLQLVLSFKRLNSYLLQIHSDSIDENYAHNANVRMLANGNWQVYKWFWKMLRTFVNKHDSKYQNSMLSTQAPLKGFNVSWKLTVLNISRWQELSKLPLTSFEKTLQII